MSALMSAVMFAISEKEGSPSVHFSKFPSLSLIGLAAPSSFFFFLSSLPAHFVIGGRQKDTFPFSHIANLY